MNLLFVIVVNHVLLEMRFIAENFPAKCARNLVDDVRVSEMILEDAF